MAASPERSDSGNDIAMPRWVKALGIAALVLVVLIALAMIFVVGHGLHGPGRHF